MEGGEDLFVVSLVLWTGGFEWVVRFSEGVRDVRGIWGFGAVGCRVASCWKGWTYPVVMLHCFRDDGIDEQGEFLLRGCHVDFSFLFKWRWESFGLESLAAVCVGSGIESCRASGSGLNRCCWERLA